MRAGDEAFDALRAAVDEFADAEAAELVAEARDFGLTDQDLNMNLGPLGNLM